MGSVPFGHFSLIDLHGEEAGAVIIAPEFILHQRASAAGVHDLSYLVVWSGPRNAAVTRELTTLAETGRTVVDSTTPELKQVLRSIAPTATPVFRRLGQCSRLFARRQLKAALRSAEPPRVRKTAS
jgi:hypothetical protein